MGPGCEHAAGRGFANAARVVPHRFLGRDLCRKCLIHGHPKRRPKKGDPRCIPPGFCCSRHASRPSLEGAADSVIRLKQLCHPWESRVPRASCQHVSTYCSQRRWNQSNYWAIANCRLLFLCLHITTTHAFKHVKFSKHPCLRNFANQLHRFAAMRVAIQANLLHLPLDTGRVADASVSAAMDRG